MPRAVKFTNPRDQEIADAHRQYIETMEARLETISDDTKGHYLKVLKSVTEKLAVPGKPLSEVVGEMMSEAAPLLFQAMQR
ncbi:MAG TPA: hypothetical protein VJN94_12435 [Candidatus Binataceae bacterium]|nr:hypothetical protein [Candidatus Binataceae bacterium]